MVRLIYVMLTLLMAVCVPHFDLLMGLTGSLTGALLSFIFPCIFHIYIKRLKLNYYEVWYLHDNLTLSYRLVRLARLNLFAEHNRSAGINRSTIRFDTKIQFSLTWRYCCWASCVW